MKYRVLVSLVAVCLPLVPAVHATGKPATLRELTEADIAQSKYIHQALLTPDGRWLAYLSGPSFPRPGEVVIGLRSVHADTERRYSAGEATVGAGNLKMSPSGKWIAFHTAPEAGVVVIEVASGARHDFKGVQRAEFLAGEKVLLQRGSDLTIETPGGERERTIQGVKEFALDPSATRLAWSGPQSVEEYNVLSRTARVLERDSGSAYQQLTWSKHGRALALLKTGGESQVLLAFTGLDKARPSRVALDRAKWAGFPQGATLSPQLQWRDDERGLYFVMQRPPRPLSLSDKPKLRVWHYKDEYLPGERQAREATPVTDWCFVDVSKRKFIRLSDEKLADVELQGRGRYVVGYDLEPYGWYNKGGLREGSSEPQLRDYYRVDLESGERTLLIRGLKAVTRWGLSILPTLSPDGSLMIYRDDAGDVVMRHLARGTVKNLTASLPVKFDFPENDPRHGWGMREHHGQGMPRVQGWSDDGRYVLVSDYYDVWALPLQSGRAINLTVNGRRDNIGHSRVVLETPYVSVTSQSVVNLREPLYFRSFDLDTAHTGLARHNPQSGSLELLHSEFADIRYLKAERADVYLYVRMTSSEAADYYRIDKDWKPEKRLTNTNPQDREIRLSPGSRYLSYKTASGGERHASLTLPAGYVEGRAYPTIVMIYKGFSTGVHAYRDANHYMQPYLQRGYAFLHPDILPRLDDAGRAAVEDVLAGVEAAVRIGIVDRSRVGLSGHSFGGYETNFIITQTNVFKAASSWAGMTNLWSNVGWAYADRWPWSQGDQPYLSRPWWQSMEVHLQNSPLYHAQNIRTPLLLVHGDQDDAVPFTQALELFNTLRELGGKPVVLLEYKGEGHGFGPGEAHDPSWDARGDFEQRELAFFDHFLRDAPAPSWWADGLSRYGKAPAP